MTPEALESSLFYPRKQTLIPSATIELAQKARLLKTEGRDIIELAGGDPDFQPEKHIQTAIIEALKKGETKYTHPRGIPSLRKAIATKLLHENSIHADPETEIIATTGGKEAIAITLMALVENGDSVLIPGPSWVSFDAMTKLAGAIPVHIAGDKNNGFKINKAIFEKYAPPNARALIFNNPHNPTGQVYTESETREIADFCKSRGIFLISDEVYEHLIFNGKKLFSPASDDNYKSFVITVNAFSKTYSMTGLRLGWLHAPADLVKKIDPVHQHLVTCASSIVQWGGVAALEGTQDGIIERRKIYSRRRNIVLELLGKSKTIKSLKPDGTFYVFLDISKSGIKSGEFCAKLLDKTGVALCPGDAFGEAGEGWARMLIARDEKILEEACDRIIRAFG